MKHYTVKQLADRYGVSERTIYREIEEGKLESTRIRGAVRVSEESVTDYEARDATSDNEQKD